MEEGGRTRGRAGRRLRRRRQQSGQTAAGQLPLEMPAQLQRQSVYRCIY